MIFLALEEYRAYAQFCYLRTKRAARRTERIRAHRAGNQRVGKRERAARVNSG